MIAGPTSRFALVNFILFKELVLAEGAIVWAYSVVAFIAGIAAYRSMCIPSNQPSKPKLFLIIPARSVPE